VIALAIVAAMLACAGIVLSLASSQIAHLEDRETPGNWRG
jgi:hypothetical protein